MTKLKINQQRYHTYIFAALMSLAFVVIISFFVHKAHAASVVAPAGEHIITLHDDGTDKGFITKAKTLRQAFAAANIRLDANDRTEPGLDEELVANSYEVNIYRARPVIIRATGAETKIITAYRTGKQIAEQAGITLHDEDIATLSRSQDVLTDGAAEVMTIKYATPFTFVFYGKTIQAYTQAMTVSEMLKSKGVTPAANDTLTPGANAPLTAGMTVQLWKNGEQTVTQDEDITYGTDTINDANHDKGYKEVKTPGVNGKKTVTYKIVMQNGIEASRQVVNSVTTKEPVKQVEIVGTKLSMPAGSHTDWMAAAGISSGNYGYAEYIIGRESGWNPNSMNASSGACGLVQAFPCSKLGPNWNDPVVALQWANSYVGRYGGWAGAYAHWMQYNSY